MEIPAPSIETVKQGWDWVLKNLQLWFEVIRTPSDFLKTTDLNSTDSLIKAIQFAVFPIVLSAFIQLPAYLATKDTSFGFVGYFIVCAVLYPACVFLAAVSQRFSAILVRGKGNLMACTIATLYAAAFWPLAELVNLSELAHRATYVRIAEHQTLQAGDAASLMLDGVIAFVVFLYLAFKFIPMTKVVHHVGGLRATIICVLTFVFATSTTYLIVNPFQKTMLLGIAS